RYCCQGSGADAARSDEDGTADSCAGRRDRCRRAWPRGRAGPGRHAADRVSAVNLAGTRITVVEVGPRDGLQNENARVSTADKIEFVNLLSGANLPVIEVSAFVSPKWVPQMADAAEVFRGITRRPGIRYTALVPNIAGLDRAIDAEVAEVAIFAAATDAFSRKN